MWHLGDTIPLKMQNPHTKKKGIKMRKRRKPKSWLRIHLHRRWGGRKSEETERTEEHRESMGKRIIGGTLEFGVWFIWCWIFRFLSFMLLIRVFPVWSGLFLIWWRGFSQFVLVSFFFHGVRLIIFLYFLFSLQFVDTVRVSVACILV